MFMRMLFTLLLTSVIAVGYAQHAKTETGTASFYHDKFVGRKPQTEKFLHRIK